MSELRMALIVIGAVFVAALLLWERRRSSRKARPLAAPEAPAAMVQTMPRVRRMEPSIDDYTPVDDPASLDVPTIHPVEPVRVEVMREVAVDVPGAAASMAASAAAGLASTHPSAAPDAVPVAPAAPAAPAPPPAALAPEPREPAAIRWPPQHTERVLTVRIVRGDGQALPGRALRHALESAGMVHGPQRIYHLADADGIVRASAANLVRPGTFDPAHMDAQEFRGLSVFCILPGPIPAVQMLEDLLLLARSVSGRVGAVVQDEQGAVLEGERLAALKRSLAPTPPDGAPA